MKHMPLGDVEALSDLRCQMAVAGQEGRGRDALELAQAVMAFVLCHSAAWDVDWGDLDALTSPAVIVRIPEGANAAVWLS